MKKVVVVLLCCLLLLLIAVPKLDLLQSKELNLDYDVNEDVEILCSNLGDNEVELDFTIVRSNGESEFVKKTISSKGTFIAKLKDVFEGEISDASLNIYSNSDKILCNLFDESPQEIKAAILGDSYIPLKLDLLSSKEGELNLKNLSDKKTNITVNILSRQNANSHSFEIPAHARDTLAIDIEEDTVIQVIPDDEQARYQAFVVSDGYVVPAGISTAKAAPISAGDKILVANVGDKTAKATLFFAGKTGQSYNLMPYASTVIERKEGEVVTVSGAEDDKLVVGVVGNKKILTVGEKTTAPKWSVLNIRDKSELILVNDSEGDTIATLYFYYSDGFKEQQSVEVNANSSKTLVINSSGYALLSSEIGIRGYLVQACEGKASAIIQAKEIDIKTSDNEIVSTSSEQVTRSQLKVPQPTTVVFSNGTASSTTEDETITDDAYEATPESLACLTDDCVETYKEEAPKKKGVSYFNYAPVTFDAPTNASIYINNLSDNSIEFILKGYSIAGTLAYNVTLTVKANSSLVKGLSVNTVRLYELIPSSSDALYSAFVVAKNSNDSWHYVLMPSTPLLGKSAVFNAKGKLSLANISNVPVLVHYQIVADGSLRYVGDEWFLPKAQRLIDLENQLSSYDSASIVLFPKKYFVQQSCETGICRDIEENGQIVADLYHDGVVYPVKNNVEVSGENLLASVSSSDIVLFVQNESHNENAVFFDVRRGAFNKSFSFLMKPFERRDVAIPSLFLDNYDNVNIRPIRNAFVQAHISANRNINVSYKTVYNSEANFIQYAIPLDRYEREDIAEDSATEYKKLKIVCGFNLTDSEKDGVCNTVESAFGTRVTSKDSDADGVDDASELYLSLSLPNEAASKVAYQDNLSFEVNTEVQEKINASFFKTDSYRVVTSAKEIDGFETEITPTPSATPDPEKEGCFTDECLEAFSNNPKKIKGESFILYAPNAIKMPDTQSKLYIKSYSDKSENFQVMMYTINGKQSGGGQSFTIKPNSEKAINVPLKDNSQYTYRIVPADDAVSYGAYILVRDYSTPMHYQIPALKPLKGRTVSFVPDGKLVVGNISNVPAMIHYQVVSDGKIIFEGDQWFLAMAQRIIDLGEQLAELENPVMHFDVKRYFVPQRCENEVCNDIDDGQLVASFLHDGAVYPISNYKDMASRELSIRVSSFDSYLDLINESAFLNEVSLNLEQEHAHVSDIFTLKPNEHKKIELKNFVSEDEGDLSSLSAYIDIEAKYPISATSKQILSSAARLAKTATSFGQYEPVEDAKQYASRELEIKCSDNNRDVDNDGVCNVIEGLLGMSDSRKYFNGRVDASGNKLSDGVALYKYLFVVANENGALVPYQDLVKDGYVAEEITSASSAGATNNFSISSFGKSVIDKIFTNGGKYRNLTIGELNDKALEDDRSTCKPIKVGEMCNGSCCLGECAGRGYQVEQVCCDDFEKGYQDNGVFGCCPSDGILPQNLLHKNGVSHSFVKEESESQETNVVDDYLCCKGGIGYPQKIVQSDVESCGGVVTPANNEGLQCCAGGMGETVATGQEDSIACGDLTKVCCRNDKCTAYDYTSFISPNQSEWRALIKQQKCCDDGSVLYQNKGHWGCCNADNLTVPESVTFYKYSFEGYLKNYRNIDFYSLNRDEKKDLKEEYERYLDTQVTYEELLNTDGDKYVSWDDRTCACDGTEQSPSASPSPTTTKTPVNCEDRGLIEFSGRCVTHEECEAIEGCVDPDDPGTDDPSTNNPEIEDPGTDNPRTDNPGNPRTDDPGTGGEDPNQDCAKVGEYCTVDADCCGVNKCNGGVCITEPEDPTQEPCKEVDGDCTKDSDCCGDNRCERGKCIEQKNHCADGERRCGSTACCPESRCAGEGNSATCCSEEQVICNDRCCAGICLEGECKTCLDTVTSTDTGEILHCKDNTDGNNCGVRHGTSENGGCCPSAAYTWCGGGCCLESQCLNPYGKTSSAGEEQCCPDDSQPCGGISCCYGLCSNGVCTACADGEVLCSNECCKGECVEDDDGQKVCHQKPTCENDSLYSLIGERCCSNNKYGTLVCNTKTDKVECSNFEEGRSCSECETGEFLCSHNGMTVPICCTEGNICQIKDLNGEAIAVCLKSSNCIEEKGLECMYYWEEATKEDIQCIGYVSCSNKTDGARGVTCKQMDDGRYCCISQEELNNCNGK